MKDDKTKNTPDGQDAAEQKQEEQFKKTGQIIWGIAKKILEKAEISSKQKDVLARLGVLMSAVAINMCNKEITEDEQVKLKILALEIMDNASKHLQGKNLAHVGREVGKMMHAYLEGSEIKYDENKNEVIVVENEVMRIVKQHLERREREGGKDMRT